MTDVTLSPGVNQNFSVFRGNTLSVTVKFGDPLPAGTKAYWWMALSPFSEGEDILSEKNIQDDGSGNLVVDLDPLDTDVPPNLYYHELKTVDSDGAVTTAVTGNVVVKMSVDATLP